MNKDARNGKYLISEAVLLSGLTVLGYMIGYYYELGFISYYKIPDTFVEVSLSIILKSLGAVVGILVLIFNIFNILLSLYPKIRIIR